MTGEVEGEPHGTTGEYPRHETSLVRVREEVEGEPIRVVDQGGRRFSQQNGGEGRRCPQGPGRWAGGALLGRVTGVESGEVDLTPSAGDRSKEHGIGDGMRGLR